VTTLLIPVAEFQAGGKANGRALACVAHLYLGNGFGTIYDLSTILWFAGASAMAGLLSFLAICRATVWHNWARARPLVLVYTVAFAVTILLERMWKAGAYATGVLVLMSSAAFAVALSARRRERSKQGTLAFPDYISVSIPPLSTSLRDLRIRIAASSSVQSSLPH